MSINIFPPLAPDHPLATDGTLCRLCIRPFAAGDVTTIVPLVPASPEDTEKMRAGRPYTAEGVIVHVPCLRAFAQVAAEW